MLKVRNYDNGKKKEIISRLLDDIDKHGGEEYCFLLLDAKEEEIFDYSLSSVDDTGALKLQISLYGALYAFVAGYKRQKYGVVIGRDGNILTLIRLVSGKTREEIGRLCSMTAEEVEAAERSGEKLPKSVKNSLCKALSFPENFYPEIEFD